MNDRAPKPGWTWVKFGDVVHLNTNRIADPEAEGIERFVGIEHIEPEDLRIRSWGLVAEGTTFTNHFRPGQVLFVKRRAYQRKVAVAEFEGVCSGDIYVLEPQDDRLLPDLLPFICQTEAFFAHAVNTSAGSLSPRTNWKQLAEYEFALPPLAEQRRIAEILHGLETSLNAYQEAHDTATRLRRSLLLTELPLHHRTEREKWPVARLGDLVMVIDPNPSHRYPPSVDNGVPLVATQDFVGDDEYRFDKCKHVPDEVYRQQLERCQFQSDDVVFARKGIIGYARKYGDQPKAFSHTIVVIKPKDKCMHAGFLLWLMRSDSVAAEIERHMNKNVGVPTLGVKTLETLKVWFPPFLEQARIAALLDQVQEARLSQARRQVETRATKELILKRLESAGGL